MDQKFENQIISLIDSVDDMTIATVRDDGFPQATTVSYVNDGLDLYFMTAADSQKVKNIAANNKVSLTINSDYQSWDEIEGLSMAALAQPVDDLEEQERIGELLMKKFPEAEQYKDDIDIDLAFFRLEPQVISLLDYKKSFGYTETVEL